MSRPPGRPSKLTPAVAERAVEAARAGATMADCAGYAGIGVRTLQRWLAEAEREDAEPRFGRFGAAFARARAELVLELSDCVRAGAKDDPRLAVALLKILEDRQPPAARVEVSGPVGGPVQVAAAQRERAIARALTATPEGTALIQAAVLAAGEPAEPERNGGGPLP